jgi:hypothetical protein
MSDLTTAVNDNMQSRLQSVNSKTRDEAVAELVGLTPELADLLKFLTPRERLQWAQRRMELLINMTPTGLERAAMTEANIRLMIGLEA